MSVYYSEILSSGHSIARTRGSIRLYMRRKGYDDSRLKFSYRVGSLEEHWTDKVPPDGWDPAALDAVVPKGYDVIVTGEIEP